MQEMRLRDGTILENPEAIHLGDVEYFSSFLKARPPREPLDISLYVEESILVHENNELLKLPSNHEVMEAIFSIPIDSSPRPDSFSFGFYQTFWDVVAIDVVSALKYLFSGSPSPRFYSTSYIVLIPKVSQLSGFDKFRPISLCLVIYKVFFKILVRRLTPILSRLVSPEQGAFLLGRSIFDNVPLAQEMLHMINQPTRGGNVFI